ncbi:B- and T-lymphocyte attenuator [Acomys russatus]|uniref:B- and T-lymphocyte attenuator n=1 Tax=Acomys russatus TaxID=60746 RepID=UPI0021E2C86F|nr:B- and T-lymphocyte attenuator [Acomys russatus]
MKTLPAMLGTPGLFKELLILHLGFWSILCKQPTNRMGEESCHVQLNVKRYSKYSVSTGELLKIKCPVTYCVQRPNVTWYKYRESTFLPLEHEPHLRTSWEENHQVSVFILQFESIRLSDNGMYRCSANSNSEFFNSHTITVHVIERAQNYSEHPQTVSEVPDATNASGPSTMEERPGRMWLLCILLPLGALPLLLTCFCVVCFLKRLQGKEKKPSDLAGREINLVDIPVSSSTNPQALPPETGVYDNDRWSSIHEESESTTNSQLEKNKQGIVYASLNHSVIGRNPRRASNVHEAPTEYASICVRS